MDKNTNFSTAQFNKGEPLIKQYNSYFVKKTNENKKNNLVSKEDILSASENNTSITKRENKDTISINSNRKSTRNNKNILLNYPRILSYGNFIDKINNNIKLNYQSLSGFDNIYKTNQTNSLIKKKLTIKYSTKGKNVFNHRKNNFNKKISKHSFEKVNNNEQKDISIWSRKKTRQLNKIKSISMDSLLLNYKDQNDNNSNIDNNLSIMNRNEIEKNKIIELSNAVKYFYNGIKSRGYSSFVRNKKSNTILNRKKKKKIFI